MIPPGARASLEDARRERDRALQRLRAAVRAAERRGVLVPLEEFAPLWEAYRRAERRCLESRGGRCWRGGV